MYIHNTEKLMMGKREGIKLMESVNKVCNTYMHDIHVQMYIIFKKTTERRENDEV